MTNCTKVDGTRTVGLDKEEQSCRKQIGPIIYFLRTEVPGFEKFCLIQSASSIGVREMGVQKKYSQRQGYTIPYGCFLPRHVDGLLIVGRCISGTHLAHSSYRVMPICVNMGQAVGIAVAGNWAWTRQSRSRSPGRKRRTSPDRKMEYTIDNDQLSVRIEDKGAELSGLFSKRDGVELLWQGNGSIWKARSPILFPVVGGLPQDGYFLGGKHYPMGTHGFLKDSTFTQIKRSVDRCSFAFESDNSSMTVYPFKFAFQIDYTLADNTLSVGFKVTNAGSVVLPF